MAELQHDRVPDPTVTQTFAPRTGELRSSAACVCVRLWSHGNLRPEDSFSSSLDPAACMANDLLVASEGAVATTRGNTLLVRFADVSQAVLAARRLQWAFQGLSEAERFSGTSVAILVSSSEDMPSGWAEDFFSASLDRAAPGQILLAGNASRVIENIPGMATEATADPGLRGLLLRRPERGSSSSADEKTLFRNIKGQTSGDLGSSEEQIHLKSTGATTTMEPVRAAEAGDEDAPGTGPEGFWAGLGQTRRIAWGAGAAVALLLVAGVIIFAVRGHAPADAISKPTELKASPVPESNASVPSLAKNRKPDKSLATSDLQAKKPNPSQTFIGNSPAMSPRENQNATMKDKPPAAACDWTAGQARDILARANVSLLDGHWTDAKRRFRSVQGCEATSAEARKGIADAAQGEVVNPK